MEERGDFLIARYLKKYKRLSPAKERKIFRPRALFRRKRVLASHCKGNDIVGEGCTIEKTGLGSFFGKLMILASPRKKGADLL